MRRMLIAALTHPCQRRPRRSPTSRIPDTQKTSNTRSLSSAPPFWGFHRPRKSRANLSSYCATAYKRAWNSQKISLASKGHKRSEAENRAIARYNKTDNGKAHRLLYDANNRNKLKLTALSICGPAQEIKCSWPECNIADPDMLSIDHVDNDGHVSGMSGNELYRCVKRTQNKDGKFQTLCHNHQWKKEITRRREVRALRYKELVQDVATRPS